MFVTGGSDGGGTRSDIATLAYSTLDGAQVWERRFDGPISGFDEVTSLVVSPLGNAVFVAGGTSKGPEGDLDAVTFAYDTEEGTTLAGTSVGKCRADFGTASVASPTQGDP